jgi:hypothetical protein
LTHPYLPLFLAGVAILLSSPALNIGLSMDDWDQRYKFTTNKFINGEKSDIYFSQFTFFDGKQESFLKNIDIGIIPWWSAEGLKISFWRPLAELTHRLDYKLWPDSLFAMHVHSLLWLGILIIVVSLFYRRFIGPVWTAGLAALIYAMDDIHAWPSAWLANRYVLFCAVFGVLAIYMHDRWRRDNWRAGAYLGPGFLALGLLSGEAGIGACAYLIAYALFLDKEGLKKGIISILPYGVIALAYIAGYKAMGFGTYGTGIYIDPTAEPARFLSAAIERVPILLFGLWSGVEPSMSMFFSADKAKTFFHIATIFVIIISIAIIPLLRGNKLAKFWATGMLLSLLPVITISPASRLMLFTALGAYGLIALFITSWFDKKDLPANKLWRVHGRICLVLLIFWHLILAPLELAKSVRSNVLFKIIMDNPANSSILIPEKPEQQIVLLNPPLEMCIYYIFSQRFVKGLPVPKYLRSLVSGTSSIKITRIDDNTIIVHPKDGIITTPCDELYRSKSDPMKIGQRVMLKGMSAEVLSLRKDNLPEKVKFKFDAPLEDKTYKFLQWKDDSYQSFVPPAVGETIIVPATKNLLKIIMEN